MFSVLCSLLAAFLAPAASLAAKPRCLERAFRSPTFGLEMETVRVSPGRVIERRTIQTPAGAMAWPKIETEVLVPREVSSSWSPPLVVDAYRELIDAVHAAVDPVLDTYRARRPDWPPTFLDYLRELAEEYADHSTFIQVRGRINEATPPESLGVVRLISPKEGKLAMEKYLGIEVLAPGTEKREAGNFQIRPDVNSDVFNEIMIQLMNQLVEIEQAGKPVKLLTYANKSSKVIYSKIFGMVPIPESELKIPEGAKVIRGAKPEDGVQIEKDGVRWTPMKGDVSNVQKALDELPQGSSLRLPTEVAEVQRLIARMNQLRTEKPLRPVVKTFSVLESGDAPPAAGSAAARLTTFNRYWDEEILMNVSFLDSKGNERWPLGIHIPNSKIPLQEGASFQDRIGQVSYKNGKLIMTRQPNPGGAQYTDQVEVEISPDLQVLRSATWRRTIEGKTSESKALFH